MAKKRTSRTRTRKPRPAPAPLAPPPEPSGPERTAVTADRFTRLCRLLTLLSSGPMSRERLTRDLELDIRGFYRDLELLRASGIRINLQDGQYALVGNLDDAVARLPFPDPHLTLGEARQLARGRSRAHRFLQEQIDRHLPDHPA
jgi:hypothetical protein